jgi:hypothetical protein
MEKYLNDTLTNESKKKSEELANKDLMPSSIKEWYERNRTESMNEVEEYKNDELGDVWNMEMVADYKPVPKKVAPDTIRKDADTTKKNKGPKEPSKNKVSKDSADIIQKKKKKNPKPKNVSNTKSK